MTALPTLALLLLATPPPIAVVPGEVVASASPRELAAGPVRRLDTARRLAAWGRRRDSPIALGLAAEILLDLGPLVAAGSGAPLRAGDPPGSPGSHPLLRGLFPSVLIAEARALPSARSVAAVARWLAVLERRAGERARGAVAGPSTQCERQLSAGARGTHLLAFRAGEPAEALLWGDGKADVDCWAFDSDQNLVGSDASPDPECLLLWVPEREGEFRVEVENLGEEASDYCLATN